MTCLRSCVLGVVIQQLGYLALKHRSPPRRIKKRRPKSLRLLSDLIDSVELLIEVSRNTFVDSSKCLQDFKIGIFTDEVG